MAIVSNKGDAAVQTARENNGLDQYIRQSLIIGDRTPWAVRKPALASCTNVLVLRLREIAHVGPWLEMGEGLVVVGGTKAYIEFARDIGSKASPVGVDFGLGIRRLVRFWGRIGLLMS